MSSGLPTDDGSPGWLTGGLPHVPGPGAYQRTTPVLLDRVPDPANRPADGEERDGPDRLQPERPRQDHQPEVEGGPLAYEVQGFPSNSIREHRGAAPGISVGRYPEQLGAPRVPTGVQRVPEARHALPPFETADDGPARVVGGFHLPQKCFDELGLPAVLAALQGGETTRHHGVRRRSRRGHAARGECRDV